MHQPCFWSNASRGAAGTSRASSPRPTRMNTAFIVPHHRWELLEFWEWFQSQGRDGMKSYGLGRLGSSVFVILMVSFSLLMAAAPGYHLLKKYSFGAAEGSTREYFDYITVDSAARRVYLSHGTEIKVIDADSGA